MLLQTDKKKRRMCEEEHLGDEAVETGSERDTETQGQKRQRQMASCHKKYESTICLEIP